MRASLYGKRVVEIRIIDGARKEAEARRVFERCAGETLGFRTEMNKRLD